MSCLNCMLDCVFKNTQKEEIKELRQFCLELGLRLEETQEKLKLFWPEGSLNTKWTLEEFRSRLDTLKETA